MGKLNVHFPRLCAVLLLIGAMSAISLNVRTHVFAVACNGNTTDATTGHATDATAATCTIGEAFDMGAGALTIDLEYRCKCYIHLYSFYSALCVCSQHKWSDCPIHFYCSHN